VLHVIDRGPGTADLASPHRGSGIGLSVVRLLIEAMGAACRWPPSPAGALIFSCCCRGWRGIRRVLDP
jgi:signal transduction histidine kinase